ncbi:MAG: Signal peptidase-like protein [Bacteroidia bacterium]
MSCGSCGKNNGTHSPGCGQNGDCSTGSCNKLNVYNWLSDMILPEDYVPFNIVEVRFKGSKKLFFRNHDNLELFTGDKVVVESDFGYDVGTISLSGELVKLQLKKYGVDENSAEMRKILRIAGEKELEKYQEIKDREPKTLERARTIAMKMNLKMKISDMEFQGDGKKVTFYYTSEGRVDFRELIKRYASEFRSRIEMRQVSYREEASRLGGIGSCGRELCCSTWLTDYKVVSMSAAKTQNLSINMLKLSGQCGRLKCCLNYELELYTEALAEFPRDDVRLKTEAGEASLKKIDILKGTLWYSYEKSFDWIPIKLDRVNEIIAKNKKGEKPATLSDTAKGAEILNKSLEYKDDLLESSDLTRMDHKKDHGRSKGRGRRKGAPSKRRRPQQTKKTEGADGNPQANRGGNKSNRSNKNRNQNRNRNRNQNKGNQNKPKD